MELVERLRERFLIRQFQGGNSDAFVELVRRYERRLLYYLGRFERDPERALDILQEVWLSAWKARASLRVPDAFRTWLYRIAHGLVVGMIRLEMQSKQAEQNRRLVLTVDVESDKAGESAEMVHFALARLTADHREVLTLRFLEDMTLREIADVTGVAEGTVKSRLHYATAAIQNVLKEQNHDRE